MTRPIKFRAWANDKMHNVRAISFNEDGTVHRILDTEGVQRVPEALLQFTGLKDKNGKEIYEGDILKQRYPGTWEVVWDAPRFKMVRHINPVSDGFPSKWNKRVEVIGNIYEDPKLLAQK